MSLFHHFFLSFIPFHDLLNIFLSFYIKRLNKQQQQQQKQTMVSLFQELFSGHTLSTPALPIIHLGHVRDCLIWTLRLVYNVTISKLLSTHFPQHISALLYSLIHVWKCISLLQVQSCQNMQVFYSYNFMYLTLQDILLYFVYLFCIHEQKNLSIHLTYPPTLSFLGFCLVSLIVSADAQLTPWDSCHAGM